MQSSTAPESTRPAADRPDPRPDPALAVETRGLGKDYRNPWTLKVSRGLHALDLAVRRGEVLGYLGPNGAGKTTTLKLLTGLLKPTRGAAWLLGESITRVASRNRLGFLPEQPYFYDYLNGVEYLELMGSLAGLGREDAHQRARTWIGRVGLAPKPGLLLRKYSKGMLQRLGLAAALLHEPELIVLDEPMSGLDPFGRRDVRELIHEQRQRGATVLFSSHILPDVEALCDRVAIVLDGRLTRLATVGELVSDSRQRVEIRCTGRPVLEFPFEIAHAIERQERSFETVFALAEDRLLNKTLACLLHAGAEVRAVTPQRATLEELFMATARTAGAIDETSRRQA